MLETVDEFNEKTGRSLAYFIVFWWGVGNLLPWVVFITAHAYFYERFCQTSFGDSFENYFSITYNCAQIFGLFLSLKYAKGLSIKEQVLYPFFVNLAIFSLMTIFVFVIDMNENGLFGCTLFFTFISGISGAFMNGGLYGFASKLHSNFISAVVIGQGLAALIVAIVNIVSAAASPYVDLCSTDDNARFYGVLWLLTY